MSSGGAAVSLSLVLYCHSCFWVVCLPKRYLNIQCGVVWGAAVAVSLTQRYLGFILAETCELSGRDRDMYLIGEQAVEYDTVLKCVSYCIHGLLCGCATVQSLLYLLFLACTVKVDQLLSICRASADGSFLQVSATPTELDILCCIESVSYTHLTLPTKRIV